MGEGDEKGSAVKCLLEFWGQTITHISKLKLFWLSLLYFHGNAIKINQSPKGRSFFFVAFVPNATCGLGLVHLREQGIND